MKKVSLLLIITLLFTACKEKKTETTIAKSETKKTFTFSVETIVDGMDIPWGMLFLPDGAMLITEQKGELIHFKDGKKTLIEDMPKIVYGGQGGLLDLEIDPKYDENGWIYISYSGNIEGDDNGSNTTVMRAKLAGNKLVNKEVIYKATPNTKKGHHFGSRLEFDNEGYLFITMGERGERDVNPQDITKDNGKIYRIHSDGTIPTDNPFYNTNGAKKAIYSYGHRNPQGMALNPTTGKIWTHEHGPKGGDEINIIESGKNYGWPVISYGVNYSGTKFTDETEREGMEQPIHYWVPSIAPSGMAFVTSDKYPEWKGNILVGSIKFQYLNRCVLEGNKVIKEEKLLEGLGRLRTVRQAPDGYIYCAIEGLGIVRIMPD